MEYPRLNHMLQHQCGPQLERTGPQDHFAGISVLAGRSSVADMADVDVLPAIAIGKHARVDVTQRSNFDESWFAQTEGYDDIEDAVDVLSLYFSLGSMQFGRVRNLPIIRWKIYRHTHHLITQSYSTSKMSPRWKAILNDMEDYGLIYKRPVCTSGPSGHDSRLTDTTPRVDHQWQET